MRVFAWGATDPGRRRSRNEDAFGMVEKDGVLVVADGIGGHRGGSVASKMAVDAVITAFRNADGAYEAALDHMRGDRSRSGTTEPMFVISPLPDATDLGSEDTPPVHDGDSDSRSMAAYSAALTLLRVTVRHAGAEIYSLARIDPALNGMGTTLTAVVVNGDRVHVAHVGDSRCYLWRKGRLQQLTEDHSLIAEQIKAGAISEKEAKQSRLRHVITRSVGFERHAEMEIRSVAAVEGDRLLLCTDGVFGLITDVELQDMMAGELEALPAQLIALANERGGDDNITAVVARLAANPVMSSTP